MGLFWKYYHLVSLVSVLILTQHVSAFCQDELPQDKGYSKCAERYHTFIEKHKALNGTHDAEAIFKTLCSPEGRTTFHCMLRYYVNCPPLANSDGPAGNPFKEIKKPGVDVQSFLFLDRMENICAMNTGTCSEIKKCYGNLGEQMKYRPESSSENNFLSFQAETRQICGEIKEAMMCVLNISKSCPESLDRQLAEKFQNVLRSRRNSNIYELSYKQTKHFILNECSDMASDFDEDTCAKEVFMSENFTTCNENIEMKYSQRHNCNVHKVLKECLIHNLKPTCGEETTMFLTRNSHVIFPGIPDDCDSGGSDISTKSVTILLTMSLFSYTLFL